MQYKILYSIDVIGLFVVLTVFVCIDYRYVDATIHAHDGFSHNFRHPIHSNNNSQKHVNQNEIKQTKHFNIIDQKEINKSINSRHKRELRNINKNPHQKLKTRLLLNNTNNVKSNLSYSPDNRKKRKADPQYPFLHNEGVNERLAQVLRSHRPVSLQRPDILPRSDILQRREPFLNSELSPDDILRRQLSPEDILRRRAFLQRFEAAGMPTEHNALRQRLLDALARRVQERNMIANSRERELLEHNLRQPVENDRPSMFAPPEERSFPINNRFQEERHGLPMAELARNELSQRLMREKALAQRLMYEKEFAEHNQPLLDPGLYPQNPPSEFNKAVSDGSPIMQSQQQMFSNVGSLGDETMPFGSLGETKPPGYIPVGRIGSIPNDDSLFSQPNQDIGNDDMSEYVPAVPHRHKGKKAWVTDVNIYSKKKKDEDINTLLNDDNDNDPLDEFVRNQCHPNPCAHGSKCTETNSGFQCACAVGFKGKRCRERNYCLPNPCLNGAVCTESSSADGFSCACQEAFFGRICDQGRTACTPSPCQNHGHCLTDGTDAFECVCQKGTRGTICQESDKSLDSIASIFHVDDTSTNAIQKSSISAPSKNDIASQHACDLDPCMNGGICGTDSTFASGFKCDCPSGYLGIICEERKCKCENGGTCIGEGIEVKCICKPGYGGPKCQEHTQCNEDTCLHGGICIEQVGGFKCKCDNGYKGQRCEELDKCKPNPCLHGGVCKDYGEFYKCQCKRGFKGKQCEDLDLCQPNPCQNNGQCFGYPGGFQCECGHGYSGKTCNQIVHCISNPCSNGAECIEIAPTSAKPDGGYKCGCKGGFVGDSCEAKDYCHISPCHNGATCTNAKDDYICTCSDKFHGKECQTINHCWGSPCNNHGKCTSGIHDFKCECIMGFKGLMCEDIDYCQPNPCRNSGYCTSNGGGNGFMCQCSEGYRGITCEESDPCYPNPCSHGHCIEIAGGYLCNCTTGFKGPKCAEINRCEPNPCFHGGSCEEINGGVGYVCQCPPGYKGQMCEQKDLCHPNPCNHNGICSDALSEYHHDAYTNAVVQTGGIECTCAKGFKGERCDDIDPCYPNPCLHNSLCIVDPRSSTTRCNCSLGWKGEHCQAADLCSPDPCKYGTHCLQTDEESYQCIKSLCTPNPCSNGGKCIVVNDEGYECACPRGWRGKNCQEQDSCVPNPCENGGICHDMDGGGYTCECAEKYTGNKCEVEPKPTKTKDFCTTYPCKNGGTCIDTEGGFICRCNTGFSGPFCEDSVCHPLPCDNGGTCVPYYGIALCKCTPQYTGARCSESKKPMTVQHSDINSGHTYEDVKGVTKSITPHMTLPTLSERVEEILNSDKDTKTDVTSPAVTKILEQYQPTETKQSVVTSTLSPAIPPALPPAPPPVSTLLKSKTDACEPNICLHGGTCIERSNGEAECICPSGFSGPICREVGLLGYSSAPKFFPKDECKHCDRNAICVNGHCICEEKYVGDGLECWPETKEDKDWICNPSPCQNGGTCKPGRSYCVCRLGYVGRYCETYCPPALHLSFDIIKGVYVQDESGNNNNAILKNGAEIVYEGGKCDSGASLLGGDILFDGRTFHPKPRDSVTMSVWVKLDTSRGIQSIFDTVGGQRSSHREGQYHLEIDNARVRWFHRNENHVTIFSILSEPILSEGNWTHITGTYSGFKGEAKLFVNGDLVGLDTNTSMFRYLSQDWDTKVGIGKHEHTFGNRLLRGMVDEFYIFDCALPRLEVLVLMHHCKIYWKHDKKLPPKQLPGKPTPKQMPQQHEQPPQRQQLPPAQQQQEISPQPQRIPKQPVINQVSVVSPVPANVQKDKSTYQNYYGFVNEKIKEPAITNEKSSSLLWTNRPVANELIVNEVTGTARFNIPGANVRQPVNSPTQFAPFATDRSRNEIPGNTRSKTVSYMRVMPDGPSALYSEVRELLNKEKAVNADKRMRIVPANNVRVQEIARKLYVQLKPNAQTRYHHPPVIRNENKVLPYSPHAYLNMPNTVPQSGLDPGVSKSTFPVLQTKVQTDAPSQINNASPLREVTADPRWFKWVQGLANVQGGTYTTTHSNTLQRNDPGTTNADTQISASQNTQGGTKVKQWQGYPSGAAGNLFVRQWGYGSNGSKSPGSSDSGGGWSAVGPLIQQVNLPGWEGNPPPVEANVFVRQNVVPQTHTTTHNHQWGYGNGNGKGNGVGVPGASGSGGGWGAGGPLTQQVNLPGWEGNPPDGPPWNQKTQDKQQQRFIIVQSPPPAAISNDMPAIIRNNIQSPLRVVSSNLLPSSAAVTYSGPSVGNIQSLPDSMQSQPTVVKNIIQRAPAAPYTSEMNGAIAKKQSTSTMHADTTIDANSGVKINNGDNNNIQVHGHQWGNGNGNGDANGYGSPGGTGYGGGWGAGGPTKQNTWTPKNAILSSTLPIALAKSFKAPWTTKSNQNTNTAHSRTVPPTNVQQPPVSRSDIPDLLPQQVQANMINMDINLRSQMPVYSTPNLQSINNQYSPNAVELNNVPAVPRVVVNSQQPVVRNIQIPQVRTIQEQVSFTPQVMGGNTPQVMGVNTNYLQATRGTVNADMPESIRQQIISQAIADDLNGSKKKRKKRNLKKKRSTRR